MFITSIIHSSQKLGEPVCRQWNIQPSRGMKFGYMLQHDHLFPWRTILQNVCLGLEINHIMNNENLAYVEDLLQKYGLNDFKDKKQTSENDFTQALEIRTPQP